MAGMVGATENKSPIIICGAKQELSNAGFDANGAGPGLNRGKSWKGQNNDVYHRDIRVILSGPPTNCFECEASDDLPNHVVILSGFGWWVSDNELLECASAFGPVQGLRLLDCPESGLSLGVAIIMFKSAQAAAKALEDDGALWNLRDAESAPHIEALNDALANQLREAHQKKSNGMTELINGPLSSPFIQEVVKMSGLKIDYDRKGGGPRVEVVEGVVCPNCAVEIPSTSRTRGQKLPLPLAISVLLEKRKRQRTSVGDTECGAARA